MHVCPWGDAVERATCEQCGEREACICVCLWLGLGQNDGRTPLYIASEKGDVAVVEALVKARAALDQARVCDRMPFSAAGRVCACVSLGRCSRADIL